MSSEDEVQKPFIEVSDQPIYFEEDWATGIGGGLWSTGAALARYFDSEHASQELGRFLSSSSCLEMGSGNGLLSVCWMALLAKSRLSLPQTVVVTDTAEHLPLIQKTLDANPHVVKQKGLKVHVAQHLWGEFDDENAMHPSLKRQFDFIIGSDCVYRRELYEPFIASLQHFAHDRTTILLGGTMVDTTPGFFDLLRRAGFSYRRLADHVMPEGYRGQQIFGIFIIQREKATYS